jgi:hypothetical protein|tara:strand:+ start:56877 stop:57464 length:588 start_codon:yes stop_codon:yes gene_type:complete
MSLDYAKVDMKLTGHNTVATFMHYVHTKDTPMRDAAELVANRLLVIPRLAPRRGIEKSTRYGYISEVDMKRILKRKDFARWQAAEKLPDAVLCKAVQEMESGLIDADLGGSLYKKRVARPGGGKRGGYRTLLSARIGSRHVFLHGFPKSDKASITQDEKKALQFAGKVFLELSTEALSKALQANVLLEVHCEQDH